MSEAAARVPGVEDQRSRGRDQWIEAGQELLRRGGIAAVKLHALTAELGLTTGSFYHHFSGMAEYLDALASAYGRAQVMRNLEGLDDPDPRVRLRRVIDFTRERRMLPLGAAMRDWAGSNPVAAEAVRSTDAELLRFLARAFEDLGYSRRSARLRAQLMVSSGVARVIPPWNATRSDAQELLDILAPDD
ncbi:MAG: TetR/AcrR family transcriptional regulator [Ilumatobacteraceae bacterium]